MSVRKRNEDKDVSAARTVVTFFTRRAGEVALSYTCALESGCRSTTVRNGRVVGDIALIRTSFVAMILLPL
jgi:hypothetical protein